MCVSLVTLQKPGRNLALPVLKLCFGSTLNFMSGAHSWLRCDSVDTLAIRVLLLGRGEAPQCTTQGFTPSKSWFLICKMGLIVTISWNFCGKIGFYEFCKH